MSVNFFFYLLPLPLIPVRNITLFLNYNMDLKEIEGLVEAGAMQVLYDAMIMTGKVVSGVSGGCLLLTSVVMLVFYIKQYIDTHGRELGILKALGYSNLEIAKSFWVFGGSVFMGCTIGFAASWAIMPVFYKVQNEDKLLPDVTIHLHPELICMLIVLPTILFAILSIGYAYLRLKKPVLELLRGKTGAKIRKAKKNEDLPFVDELKKSTVRQKKSLVFFMAFAAFCYSAMMQMSFSMDELASEMMSVMTLTIGIVLAYVSLFLAITTVINSNMKTIAMMKVFGYPLNSCSRAILAGYRPIAYIGFVVGTFYQYGLIKMVVTVVFKDIENVPEYNFDIQAFAITLISFVIVYEIIMYCYTRKIKRISLKEIMMACE